MSIIQLIYFLIVQHVLLRLILVYFEKNETEPD